MMMAKDEKFEGFFNMRMIITIVLAIVIISSGVLGYNYLSKSQDPFPGPGTVAKVGDRVAINYTGSFEDGTIFDTSILEVAEDDALYPKALSFSDKQTYQPLTFTIGSGEVIKGFENGVLDLGIGQTITIIVPPEDGYGDTDPNLIDEISLVTEVPMFMYGMNSTIFRDTYGIDAVAGMTITDVVWGWNSLVYFVDEAAGEINIRYEPAIGDIIDYNGVWESEVIGIDSSSNGGVIILKHLLEPSDAFKVHGTNNKGEDFIITEVDLDAGTAKMDRNKEVVGKTLIFKITLENIIEESVSA